jgi:hypothetical protein
MFLSQPRLKRTPGLAIVLIAPMLARPEPPK